MLEDWYCVICVCVRVCSVPCKYYYRVMCIWFLKRNDMSFWIVIKIEYKWQVEYMLNCDITSVLRCCVYWFVSYELYNHTTVKPFKGDEYCDGIHCENRTSCIPFRRDELKLFWEQLRSYVFCIIHR